MAKSVELKRKGGVVFNVLDPDQKKLYDHVVNRANFSGYVKRLIQRDLEGGSPSYVSMTEPSNDGLNIDVDNYI